MRPTNPSQLYAIGHITACFIIMLIALAAFWGYIWNIVKLISAETAGEVVVRAIGIFLTPLGMIAGYF